MTEPKVERRKLSEFLPDPENPNQGTERGEYMIKHSVEQLGAGRSLVADKDGTIVSGNKTQQQLINSGLEDAIVVHTMGKEIVIVQRDDFDLDDPDPNNPARRYSVLDNRTQQVSLEWNPEVMVQMREKGFDFSDSFLDWEMEALLDPPPAIEPLDLPNAKPNKRNFPIDVVFTGGSIGSTALDEPRLVRGFCCIAALSGLIYGVQSTGCGGVCMGALTIRKHKVQFIDNDYFHYDHDLHTRAVQKWRPKYATTRDFMSKVQCQEAGIEFYDLDQILDWAEELSQFCENVIVIPKIDVLDKIPSKYILGYSIPTTHGGTPLPIEAFRGRRVHLLGGSWKAQLAHMAVLGDDIVSVDNNYVLMQAKYGNFSNGEGENVNISELGIAGIRDVTNPFYIALSLSFGYIGAKINELYGEVPEDEDDDPIGDVGGR